MALAVVTATEAAAVAATTAAAAITTAAAALDEDLDPGEGGVCEGDFNPRGSWHCVLDTVVN